MLTKVLATRGLHCTSSGGPNCRVALRPEDVHGPHNILSADGALAHALATLATGHHVATLQQDTVNRRVHADPTQVLLLPFRTGRLCQDRKWSRLELKY